MAKRATKKKAESELISALKFVALAQQDIGEPFKTHCQFYNGYVVAFDGVLTAGTPAQIEANVCPHTLRLIEALERVGGVFSLTIHEDRNSMLINAEKFRANVPYLAPGSIQLVGPDALAYPLANDFRGAADIALMNTTEGAIQIAYAAGMTGDGTVIGTNGVAFIEARHGSRTPPGLIIPKAFFNALSKTAKNIVGFGYTESSFTVWFEDKSFLRTQLYVNERFPNIDLIRGFCDAGKHSEVPKGFFEAVKAVASFNSEGRIYLRDEKVMSHDNELVGASHFVKGLPACGSFVSKFVMNLDGIISNVDFASNDRVMTFFGNKDGILFRGALAKSSD